MMTTLWGSGGFGKVMSSLLSSTPTESGGVQKFGGIQQMARVIEGQRCKLQIGSSKQQFISFTAVTLSDLEQIEEHRMLIGKDCRFSHDAVSSILTIKLMPTVLHEAAHAELAAAFRLKVAMLGLDDEVGSLGSARFRGRKKSKEGDSAFKPITRSGEKAWPSIVLESGYSECLSDLEEDARFWFIENGGEVKIVILICILSEGREYHLERWEVVECQPQCMQQVDINLDECSVAGGSLKLDFQKIFCREPVGTERDIIFTENDLLKWGLKVFTLGCRQ